MRYYLGGPMTGLPDFNFPYFEYVANLLREMGYEIASAHEVVHPEPPGTRGTLPHGQYVRGDLKVLLDCDAVIFLPGWEGSKGCGIELKVARALDMPVYRFQPENNNHPDRIQAIPVVQSSGTVRFHP